MQVGEEAGRQAKAKVGVAGLTMPTTTHQTTTGRQVGMPGFRKKSYHKWEG